MYAYLGMTAEYVHGVLTGTPGTTRSLPPPLAPKLSPPRSGKRSASEPSTGVSPVRSRKGNRTWESALKAPVMDYTAAELSQTQPLSVHRPTDPVASLIANHHPLFPVQPSDQGFSPHLPLFTLRRLSASSTSSDSSIMSTSSTETHTTFLSTSDTSALSISDFQRRARLGRWMGVLLLYRLRGDRPFSYCFLDFCS
ncbi:hypothetical protein BC829DRAFT_50963 [Chytridium lagenaria]|nr:hypothetical protein BC829DRAFT_50963 [Chytridium lagenaria]